MTSTVVSTVTAAAATSAPAPAPSTDNPKPRSQTKTRKRASKACLSCRARKVRCDVSQRGRPCMNCYLDSETCVVTGRASRYRRPRESDVVKSRQDETTDYPMASAIDQQPVHHSNTELNSLDHNHVCSNPDADENLSLPATNLKVPAQTSQIPDLQARNNGGGILSNANFSSTSHCFGDDSQGMNSDIVYSYYPFISASNIANIPPQDVNFLELQGCLRVPIRPLLDEFLQQYFLHVHPMLPLVNEGDFWDLYSQNPKSTSPDDRLSLLLLQTILFASCNFVSKTTLKALGFPSIRAARASLYRRGKLLYDLEAESSPLASAQAAVLLSLWAPPSTKKPNTSWLSLAIQHAKSAEAHHYASMPVFSAETHPLQHRKQNILKRVWWCCVIRDRTLGLLMRRPIQITREHFDFETSPVLGFPDLVGEFGRSQVYSPDTKRWLAEILVQLVELYVVLTDIIVLVFPLDDTPGWGRDMAPEDVDRIRECKMALRRWYKDATLRFPMSGRGGQQQQQAESLPSSSRRHGSVILYTNLMYMYYHSTRVVLCHHEILHLAIIQAMPRKEGGNNITRDLSIIYENRHELQDAASGVTECLKELVQLKLARWLPISAVACTALPLVLNILDVKLSSRQQQQAGGNLDRNAAAALKQHRLNILIEAMKTYQPQYDGVDWVSEIVRHIVNLAQIDDGSAGEDGGTGGGQQQTNGITDWTDILASNPSSYLRLALALDLSLSKGRLPEDGDFPVSLRGLFTGGFNPLKGLVEANRASNGNAQGGNMGAHFQQQQQQQQHQQRTLSQETDSMCSPTDSHMTTNSDDAANEALRDQVSSRIRSDAAVNTDLPPSEGIWGLGRDPGEVLPIDDHSPSSGSHEGLYIDGPLPDISAEWLENLWDEMGDMEDKTDRDTARLLLEALKEGEA
uniref:Zn(2)-C6 fungal-type domain-containing protein n=1 Tax=Bionectria ochroleuca TaxID=29856 RepID=A0A8H7N7F7_BIOOC